jgi:AcrR family transcriptional regulator
VAAAKTSTARNKDKRPGQPGGVRDTNRKQRTRQLLDAALLLFLERGIEGVSVDDITSSAQMAKGSFYRYFDDQTALVRELVRPTEEAAVAVFNRALKAIGTADTKELQANVYVSMGEVLGTFLLEHAGVARLYLQESRSPGVGARAPLVELSKTVGRYAVQITERAQQHGILKPIPPVISALAVVGAIERLLLGVLLEEPLGNPLEIPPHLVTLILDGLKA